MTSVDGGMVAFGASLLLASAGATFKAAHLKSDTVSGFKTRVAIAQAGLDEQASRSLRLLARRVNEVLGNLERFNPNEALGDPAELKGYVDKVSHLLDARRGLPAYFNRMLGAGPRLLVLLCLLDVALPIAFSYYAGFHRVRPVGVAAMSVCVLLTVLIGALFVRYFVSLHRFAGAEVSAMSEDDA